MGIGLVFSFLKAMLYLGISFVIFCLPIGDKLLFDRLYEVTSPYTFETTQSIRSFMQDSWQQGKLIGSKVIRNVTPSPPPELLPQEQKKMAKSLDDQVNSILSGANKKTKQKPPRVKQKASFDEEYDLADRQALGELLGQ